MKKLLSILFCFFCLAGLAQRPFTAGNIVVYRVGDGTTVLNTTAFAVYLDEYTPAGVLVQSIPMPTTASGTNSQLTVQGNDIAAGLINLSANGKYLLIPGYNSVLGASGNSTAAVLGVMDFNGGINTSTVVTNATDISSKPITMNSDDGVRLWFGGGSALRYTTLGSTTSVLLAATPNAVRDLKIVNGQLYAATSTSPRAWTVGTGLPTSGTQTLTAFPGLPANIQGPGQFALLDLNPAVAGPDVMYIASPQTSVSAAVGIRKFSLVSGTWVDNGTVGGDVANGYYFGLTASASAGIVSIYATRQGLNASAKGGELVKVIDNSGYNTTITGTPVVLAASTVANTLAYRGVAFVPQPAPFTPGNLAVYRIGDGSATLNSSASKVFIDEFTVDGTLVQSLLMPTQAAGSNKVLTAKGTDFFSGMIHTSLDGRYLLVPGTNVAPGTATNSTAAVVGMIDYNAKLNTSTAITDFTESTNNPTSVVSDDGTRLWIAGTGAVRFATAGASTSTLLATDNLQVRDLSIAGGQLYAATATSPKLFKVGSGLPVSGTQTLSALPGIPANVQGPGQIVFADMEPSVPGVDVLYVASSSTSANTSSGIRKFSLVNGTWVGNGATGAATTNSYFIGLTIKVNAGVPTLFATRQGANNSVKGGELVKIIDNSGYNGELTALPQLLFALPGVNTAAFRGVATVPVGCVPVSAITIPDISSSAANVRWTASTSGSYEYAVSTSVIAPVSGTATNATSVSLTALTNNTTYYFFVRSVCGATGNSEWISNSFTTGCKQPPVITTSIAVNPTGSVDVKWNKVFGAQSYEYFISTSGTPPSSGTVLTDTAATINGLRSVTAYFLHVRSFCGGGVYSPWTSKPFSTDCFMPAVTVVSAVNAAKAFWPAVSNASGYEFAVVNTPAKPVTGQMTLDTSFQSGAFKSGSTHYLNVRTACSNGGKSQWTTVRFQVAGVDAYPNPVKDVLTIRFSGLAASGTISIADAAGRVVHRQSVNTTTINVNTRSWAAGIYHIRYDNGGDPFMFSVMKQASN